MLQKVIRNLVFISNIEVDDKIGSSPRFITGNDETTLLLLLVVLYSIFSTTWHIIRISSDVPCGAENVVCTTTDNNTITC